jgi:hypothetical protein
VSPPPTPSRITAPKGFTMKVTTEHRDTIEDAIAHALVMIERNTGLNETAIRQRYRDRQIPRGELVQDIDKRFRWDLYWAAARHAPNGLPDSTDGYNDAHIDTALRSIVSPL